jgi:hypothetical protein
MAKKKTAPKTKAAPKAAQSPAKEKKPQGTQKKAGSTPKIPKWLKPSPTEYIVGTEDYGALIQDHNEKFGTAWNKFRVRPQVFYTIHERIWKHYNDKK